MIRRSVRSLGPAALVVALALAPTVQAVTTPATATARPDATRTSAPVDPWHDPSYQPRPGTWRPYVLAPTSHTVKPTSVESADPRGGAITGDLAAALGGRGSVTLSSSGDRTSSPLLTLDFGKEVGGEIRVHLTDSSSPAPELHACFSESRAQMALTPGQNNGEATYAPGCDTANIWTGYPGVAYNYDADSHTLGFDPSDLPTTVQDNQPRGGFRYVTFFLSGAGQVTFNDVTLDFQAAPKQADPAAYDGWFLSSDNALNKLWYAGAYTVQMDTWLANTAKSWPYADGESDHADATVPHADPGQEVVFDGAKRDRIVWQGDLAVQAPVTYLTTNDVAAVNNSLTSLAAQQLPDGFMPAESLVGQHNQDEIRTYGEYVTWFVHNEYEHWLYTGDRGYLRDNWTALTRAVAWLESVRAQDPKGLIGFGAVGSCGHYGYSDCGHETYVNALYARNLAEMAKLAKVLGESSGDAYAARSSELTAAINDQLWDDSVGAYRLSREIPNAYPQDANAIAVLAGIASPSRARRALAYLRKHDWSTYGSLTVSTDTPNSAISPSYEPLPSGFEAEARLSDDSALQQLTGEQLLDRYWGYQLSQDPGSTFWEKVNTGGDPTIGQFTSLAHGWASAPTIALTNQVLGVTPTTGGYATFAIVPHPGDLTWGQGRVPTPHGAITASWRSGLERFRLDATVPRGTSATLAAPTSGAPVKVLLDGQRVSAHEQDGYVRVSGVGAGTHTLEVQRVGPASAAVDLVATPATVSATAGATATVHATVTGSGQGHSDAEITTDAPKGWTVTPAQRVVPLGRQGRPASSEAAFTIAVPASADPGTYHLTIAARAGDAEASDTVTVTVEAPGFSFDSGTMGWQAGANATGVAQVTSFANRPGSCASGGCLEVHGASVAATAVRSAYVEPEDPLDMSGAAAFQIAFDCYGGVPGATGYQAVVTLTSVDGSARTKTFDVSSDTWSTLSVPLSGWSGATAVRRVEVGFSAVGTDFSPWTGNFQLDQASWS